MRLSSAVLVFSLCLTAFSAGRGLLARASDSGLVPSLGAGQPTSGDAPPNPGSTRQPPTRSLPNLPDVPPPIDPNQPSTPNVPNIPNLPNIPNVPNTPNVPNVPDPTPVTDPNKNAGRGPNDPIPGQPTTGVPAAPSQRPAVNQLPAEDENTIDPATGRNTTSRSTSNKNTASSSTNGGGLSVMAIVGISVAGLAVVIFVVAAISRWTARGRDSRRYREPSVGLVDDPFKHDDLFRRNVSQYHATGGEYHPIDEQYNVIGGPMHPQYMPPHQQLQYQQPDNDYHRGY